LTIRESVVDELGVLSTAMGVKLTEDELIDRARPDKLSSFDPRNISLGVKIDRIGKAGWGLYFLLWWSKGEANLWVSIWVRDGKLADSIFTAFNKSPSRTLVALESREVYISRTLVPNDAGQLGVILRELIREFSELWTKAGGLNTFLKP